jgi:dTDP-4-dehydrorhamnose reductase
MAKNILIFGGGHVSQGIQKALHDTNHEVHCITSDTIDYSDFAAIRDYIVKKIYPDIVINTVAYTDVPGAELRDKKALVQELNVIFPVMASIWTNNIHAEFVHFSTNFVFDGKSNELYDEYALTNPLNYYGITKNRADIILSYRPLTKIFRLAGVYSNQGFSFASQMKTKFMDIKKGLPSWHNSIDVVEDQFVQPSHADWIGEVVVQCLDKPYYGMYNLVPDGYCSYADWAEHMLDRTDKAWAKTKINRIVSDALMAQQVARPKRAILDNTRIKETFGLTFPTWQEVYDRYSTF